MVRQSTLNMGSTAEIGPRFCHVITHTQQREEPDESGGGILADEMGMGKTLTILALIGKTMGDASQWVERKKHLQDSSLAETPCRATLVIVPSHGKASSKHCYQSKKLTLESAN
jgi:hypothetical protein